MSPWSLRLLALLSVASLVPGCSHPRKLTAGSPTSPASAAPRAALPPVPSERPGAGGPGQPPVIWVGGTLQELARDHLAVREAIGAVVRLRRLAGEATRFFRAAGGTWLRFQPAAPAEIGQKACAETLLDGANLLALRVFMGADCGPTQGA